MKTAVDALAWKRRPRKCALERVAALSTLVMCDAQASDLTILIKSNGAPVDDAVVYAKTHLPLPVPVSKAVDIDQVNLNFVPPVSVVQGESPSHFPNSDNVRHQVYSFSAAKVFTPTPGTHAALGS